MKETQIQKELRDFRRFKDLYSKICLVEVFDNEGHCIYENADIDPFWIFVMIDDHQQYFIFPEGEHHGTIFYLDEDTEVTTEDLMDFDVFYSGITYVDFKDKNHRISFTFHIKDWKKEQ